MSTVTQNARRLNLPEEKLLGDWIVTIPGFTLEKYRKLQRSRLSIFSMTCFGGILSHNLGLPFLTPFINMWLPIQDYMRFLQTAYSCMKEELTLKKMVWNDAYKYHHPIATLGNVDIVLNHDRDFNVAKKTWDERKQKINWYNLFVTGFTTEEKILQEFDALPYGKKVCFVPFKSDLDSAWYINPEIDSKPPYYFTASVNNFSHGKYFYYDWFDMLLYGKKTQLMEM